MTFEKVPNGEIVTQYRSYSILDCDKFSCKRADDGIDKVIEKINANGQHCWQWIEDHGIEDWNITIVVINWFNHLDL
jgi:hypothetical protein